MVNNIKKRDPFMQDLKKVLTSELTQKQTDFAMTSLYKVNPINCFKEIIFLRQFAITNTIKQNLWYKLFWLAKNHPNTFYKNLPIYIALTSWEDLFDLMRYDVKLANKTLNWNKIFILIDAGLKMQGESDKIKFFLPTIKSRPHQCTARGAENFIIGNYISLKLWPETKILSERHKCYRKLKASCTNRNQELPTKLFSDVDVDDIELLFKNMQHQDLLNLLTL